MGSIIVNLKKTNYKNKISKFIKNKQFKDGLIIVLSSFLLISILYIWIFSILNKSILNTALEQKKEISELNEKYEDLYYDYIQLKIKYKYSCK